MWILTNVCRFKNGCWWFFKVLLNVPMSLIDIPCFHSVTRYFICQNKYLHRQLDLIFLSTNCNHKWWVNLVLHEFLELSVINNVFFAVVVRNSHIFVFFVIYCTSFTTKVFLVVLTRNFISFKAVNCIYILSLILNLSDKISEIL